MSLLASASPWNNDDTNKKRQPSMTRKTIKKPPTGPGVNAPMEMVSAGTETSAEYISEEQNYQESTKIYNIEETSTIQEDRSNRVNDVLNKITGINAENDGNSLANFVPLDAPKLNKLRDNEPVQPPGNLLLPNTTKSNYSANNLDATKLSNYNTSYEPPSSTLGAPSAQSYYSRMGLGQGENKLTEKLNYMIHLLEQQQDERTNNVMEEFILYTFLGVFIIFIADSFSRTGKYTR